MVSPEDVAWADSCLTKDPDELDAGWNSIKEALLETLNGQGNTPALKENKISEEPKMEKSSFSEETGIIDNLAKTNSSIEGAERGGGDPSTDEKTDDFWSRYNAEDVFRPTYNEGLQHLGTPDPEVDLDVSSLQLHQLNDDLFKIWDLDIPPMEDEFVTQLDKAISESSVEPTPSVSNSAKPLEGLNVESLDDLILGIADLSLSPNSV